MRYALLIYKDERDWDALGESGQAEVMQGHAMTAQWLSERGMIRGESLLDGTVDLAFVALCNDYLALCADNEELMREREEKNRG